MPMPFDNAVMTNGGAALLTKAQAGECKIEFTRMSIGDGTYDEDERTIAALQERTDLKELKNSYPISGCSVYTEHAVKITALLTNQDPVTLEPLVTVGYYINEVGLFAKEADGAESTEVLYSIAVTSGEQGDFMPPYNDYNPAQITQDFYATVDNSAEVVINSAGAAFTVEQAKEMKAEIDAEIALISHEVDIPAEAHNGIFRGKDLTDVYTLDELSAMIRAGDFSDIYIGDYITVLIASSLGGEEEVDLVIAALDYFYNCGDTELTTHHVVLVPKDDFATTAKMNSSATTSGGYAGSAMHTEVLPTYYEALNTALDGHILGHRRYLTTTVSTSAASAGGANLTGSTTACSWSDANLCLMSEAMIYGGSVFSSSGFDVADACIQLPIFALRPEYRIGCKGKGGARYNFWLCSVASSTSFCDCNGNGLAYYTNASNENGVRPYFLFS